MKRSNKLKRKSKAIVIGWKNFMKVGETKKKDRLGNERVIKHYTYVDRSLYTGPFLRVLRAKRGVGSVRKIKSIPTP